MNFCMKLFLLTYVTADEPNADCDYVEIGLVCRSDCEDTWYDCQNQVRLKSTALALLNALMDVLVAILE